MFKWLIKNGKWYKFSATSQVPLQRSSFSFNCVHFQPGACFVVFEKRLPDFQYFEIIVRREPRQFSDLKSHFPSGCTYLGYVLAIPVTPLLQNADSSIYTEETCLWQRKFSNKCLKWRIIYALLKSISIFLILEIEAGHQFETKSFVKCDKLLWQCKKVFWEIVVIYAKSCLIILQEWLIIKLAFAKPCKNIIKCRNAFFDRFKYNV